MRSIRLRPQESPCKPGTKPWYSRGKLENWMMNHYLGSGNKLEPAVAKQPQPQHASTNVQPGLCFG